MHYRMQYFWLVVIWIHRCSEGLLKLLNTILDELLVQFLSIFLVERAHSIHSVLFCKRVIYGIIGSKGIFCLSKYIGNCFNYKWVVEVIIVFWHYLSTHDWANVTSIVQFFCEWWLCLVVSWIKGSIVKWWNLRAIYMWFAVFSLFGSFLVFFQSIF